MSFFVFQALLFLILCGQLVPQAVVDALLFQQLGVGALFHDALLAQHKDAVVVLDSGCLLYTSPSLRDRG